MTFINTMLLTDSWITLNEFPSEGRVAGTQFSYNGKGLCAKW